MCSSEAEHLLFKRRDSHVFLLTETNILPLQTEVYTKQYLMCLLQSLFPPRSINWYVSSKSPSINQVEWRYGVVAKILHRTYPLSMNLNQNPNDIGGYGGI